MDKTTLQQVLSRLDPLEDPDVELEQYQTPPDIAADVLHRMELGGDLEDKVLDLGCGNGVFTIGAAVMGADATGVDVDEAAIETARHNLESVQPQHDEELSAGFSVEDVRELDVTADTVVTNPPFGLQREDMNRVFLAAAFDAAPVVYALLHQSHGREEETRAFLERFAENHGFRTAVPTTYDFPLPRTAEHHEMEKKYIKVDLYRFEQV